jgi:transcriptional regulator with XRE-family HTH domain
MPKALAENLRRLMAREGVTQAELGQRAGLNHQTVKQILAGRNIKPHARTLHKLARGLSVSSDELFRGVEPAGERTFDRQTNPVVDRVLSDHPELCAAWSVEDFDELYSHRGAGGELTYEGTLRMIERMNHARAIQRKASIVLQTEYGGVLSAFVELLYRQVKAGGGDSHEAVLVSGSFAAPLQ